RRWRFHAALRSRVGGAERKHLRQMARLRRRGYGAVLRVAPPRCRLHQKQPAEADRRGYGLALLQRAATRVEGVNGTGGLEMALRQTRRGFIGGIAAVGASACTGVYRAHAAEGALETTTVRLLKFP